tara:strand:+ start:3770 stop:4099 length:330 start_codon:yes stop_codon:yes gene_type:complete
LNVGFALLRECLFLFAQEKAPKEAHPSSAPASPVHADAHVGGMRQKTHIAFAMLKHFAAPAQRAGHPPPLRVCVASQWGPIQRRRPQLCLDLADCGAFEHGRVGLRRLA